MGQLKFINLCLHCDRDQREGSRSLLSLETRPYKKKKNEKTFYFPSYEICLFKKVGGKDKKVKITMKKMKKPQKKGEGS